MLKHILVPLDGSLLSEMALDYARDIVAVDGKVTLVSVIETPLDYDYTLVDIPLTVVTARAYDEKAYSNTYQRVQEYLNGKAKELSAEGFEVHCVVETGEPATVITDVASRNHVGAIVMTTHGRTGISRWLFGSVTQKVISAMPCPVFVVPGRVTQKAEEPEVVLEPVGQTS